MPKINDEYDIGKAFEAIENELIASMIRNMKRHKLEEIEEDKQWTMWQAEMLKSLEKYKKENQKKYKDVFKDINKQIKTLISIANTEGQMSQEISILNAIKNGFKAKRVSKGAYGEFFKLNERKLEALIKATMDDMEKAETAVLRMANDQYRKVIYNAQVYANTGAGTYEKAIDMATKDMLEAGLNCIVYANGARHTLSDYADMAIRTASKRAYLQGEGLKRQEWGITTVIVNKRGNPCPKCLPFCGKVLIDDVWSGGKASDGPYPLMSKAIEYGLYHPRCKDSHTTYFPGISTAEDTWTEKELEDIGIKAKQEAKQQYAERQEEKYRRLEKFSLDKENKKQYKLKTETWSREVKSLTELEPIKSNANWDDLIGIDENQSKELNVIHSDLNKHMIENSTEKSIVYSLKDNKILAVDIGNDIDEVELSKHTMQVLKNSRQNDIILSHVHPNSTGFSRPDIDKIVINKSIKAVTVECPDGTKYVLSRGRYKTTVFGYIKYDKAFAEAEKEAQDMYPAFGSNDIMELEKIWPDYVDERNQRIADKLGMNYRKVEPNEK